MKSAFENLFLSNRDQRVIAILILAGGLMILIYFLVLGGQNSGLVDVDQAKQKKVLFQVDLNQAAWPELAVLPGIGEKLAKSIVEHRERHGAFRSHEDLTQIRGIGMSKLAAMKPHLRILAGAGTE